MALYQQSVLKKYLATQDKEQVKAAYGAYSAYFLNKEIQENIRNAKEEQFQQKFLMELFVNILGYVMNPDAGYNLTTELKNIKDAKKTDGAILNAKGAALAVIELKGTDTKDLDKVNDQAFNYKNNQPDCDYVITSNFEKLRFYIHNAVEHEEFNLFTLSEERFSLLWLFLQKDNLLGGIPAKVKDESLLREDKITKALYADYSAFKNALWTNMVERNPQHDHLLLYKKSQKLLDRFLFIFFAEDKGLLPPNSISVIIEQWQKLKDLDEYKPLYDRFKKYFGYMNNGYKGAKYEIHAYNGGLFKADELLDGLLIDDELLKKHCLKLTNYDFADEVDTNILGHIFEHSLNDIENVRAQLAGEEVDKSKTKRKKDGVFYTPKYITKYIVDNTVGKLCEEKKAELGIDDEEFAKDRKGRKKETIKKLNAQLKEYRQWLLQLTICDPACGSGAFLNQALEFLMAEHHYVDELEAALFEGSIVFQNVENHILENNIYGVDINEESVEIARLSLWLRTAKKGRKLTSLSSNIKCGNSLIDDPEVAGDLAFNWQNEFPTVFAKGGFDVVIGNPPYVAKTFDEIFKNYLKSNYETAQYQLDLYVTFMEKAVEILNTAALVGFIVPNSWLKNLMFGSCREFLARNLNFLIIIPNLDNVFEEASVDTLVYVGRKGHSEDNSIDIGEFNHTLYNKKHSVQQNRFLENDKFIFNVEVDDQSLKIFEKIDNKSIRLTDICEITRGINPYDKYRGQSAEVIKNKLYHADFRKDDTFVPELRGKHINRYEYLWDEVSYVSYGEWLAAPREPKYFEGDRILCRQILSSHLNCCLITEHFIIDQSVFIAKLSDEHKADYSSIYIVTLLASKLLAYYFKFKSNEFDALFPKIKIGEFRELPIAKIDSIKQIPFSHNGEMITSLTKEISTIEGPFLSHLQSKFDLPKPSTKLKAWPSLDFKGFLAELKKAKVVLGLEEEAEWMAYFNKKKAEANALQSEIDRIDKEIDQMVYALYELTPEEIEIVENS